MGIDSECEFKSESNNGSAQTSAKHSILDNVTLISLIGGICVDQCGIANREITIKF